MVQERRDFLAAYVQSLHDFGRGTVTNLYPERGGAAWGHAMRRMLELIERYELRPAEFETGLEERAVNVEPFAA